jgi:AraC family transcriptional regulator
MDTAHCIGRFAHAEPERVLRTQTGDVVGAIWSHPPTQTQVKGLDHHALALHLSGCTLVEKWCDGRSSGHRSRVGSISLVPAARTTDWVIDGHCRVAHAYVHPAALADAAERLGRPWPSEGLADFFADEDPQLQRLLRWLFHEAMEDALDPFALEQWQALLFAHLVRRDDRAFAKGADAVDTRRIALTSATLRRLFAHIEEHLSGGLSLRTLAETAHLSPDHFLRAFKLAVGETPHQYVMGRRLDHAQEWLVRTDMAVIDIAQQCGFRGASHFSAAFRRQFGLTPTDWRQQRRR